MDSIVSVFRERLFDALQTHPEYRGNTSALARDAGMGRTSISNMLNDERVANSRTGPGLFNMARVAGLLGVSLDHLAGLDDGTLVAADRGGRMPLATHLIEAIAAQVPMTRERPSTDALLRLHFKSGGRIEAFENILEHCDQYYPPKPTDTSLRVKHVGRRSLSALTMGEPSVALLQGALDKAQDDELRENWLRDYTSAANGTPQSTLESLDVQMENHPIRVKMDFIRTLLGVRNQAGETTVLNFCQIIV